MNVRQLITLLADEDLDAEVIVEPFITLRGDRTGPIHPIANVNRGTFPITHDAFPAPSNFPESTQWVSIQTTDAFGQAPKNCGIWKTDDEWADTCAKEAAAARRAGIAKGVTLAVDAVKKAAGAAFVNGDEAMARALRALATTLATVKP